MGTYEDLKAAIQQVIRTNGNNEITGAILQQTLLSIVNSIGANATFAGIATPETNPGTADQYVYYLATQPGVYANFNGITIGENEAVFISNKNGIWTKNASGFATRNEMESIVKKLTLLTIVDGQNLFDKDSPDVLIDKYIQGANIYDSASYNTSGFIAVQPGKMYYCANDAAEGFRIVNFYESQNSIPTYITNVNSFEVPANVNYIRVVFSKAAYPKAQVSLQQIDYVAYSPNFLEQQNMGNTANSIVSKNYVDKVGNNLIQTSNQSGIVYELIRNLTIKAGDTLYLKLTGSWSRSLIIYNGALSNRIVDTSNFPMISGEWYKFTAPVDIYSLGVNIIDGAANLAYSDVLSSLELRLSSLNDKVEMLENDVAVNKTTLPDMLFEKKYIACGDSFTHGDFTGSDERSVFDDAPYKGKNKVYPFVIARRTGAIVINEAINGSTMAYIDGSRHEFSTPGGRYTQIPEDADIVTLYFGINDSHQGVPIGTIDDNVNTTFYGAWNIVMQWLLENRPYTKIGIIITNGSTPEYTEVERNIAKKYGVPFLDLELDYQIPYMLRQNERVTVPESIRGLRDSQFMVGNGNSHPNVKCHELESTFIEQFLKRL